MEYSDFILKTFLDDACGPLRQLAEQKGLRFSMTFNGPSHGSFRADCGRIRQALTSLGLNAIQLTSEGEVGVSLETLEEDEESALIRFEVRGYGGDVPEGALKKLFQVLILEDDAKTGKPADRDPGLLISKGLVERMGGKICLEDGDEKGGAWIILRLAKSASASVVALEKGLLQSAVRGARILVVEDNYMNQQVALKHLEKLGFKVHAVENGLEALDALRVRNFDLVLMDCQMPELDGYETTRRIRASGKPAFNSIPIVAMTANNIAGDREACEKAGMNDYIAKPFEVRALVDVLNRWLSKDGNRAGAGRRSEAA
jgi:CheY-like chemotaxis protein